MRLLARIKMAAVLSEEPRLEAKVTVNHKQAVDDIQKIVQNHEESANNKKKKKRRNKKGRFQTCLGRGKSDHDMQT